MTMGSLCVHLWPLKVAAVVMWPFPRLSFWPKNLEFGAEGN